MKQKKNNLVVVCDGNKLSSAIVFFFLFAVLFIETFNNVDLFLYYPITFLFGLALDCFLFFMFKISMNEAFKEK